MELYNFWHKQKNLLKYIQQDIEYKFDYLYNLNRIKYKLSKYFVCSRKILIHNLHKLLVENLNNLYNLKGKEDINLDHLLNNHHYKLYRRKNQNKINNYLDSLKHKYYLLQDYIHMDKKYKQ